MAQLSVSVSFWLPVCQNCIEVDAATISGIVVADVVATIFLAVAVYCITGQDKGRMSRGEGGAGMCLSISRSCVVLRDFPSLPTEPSHCQLQAAGSLGQGSM